MGLEPTLQISMLSPAIAESTCAPDDTDVYSVDTPSPKAFSNELVALPYICGFAEPKWPNTIRRSAAFATGLTHALAPAKVTKAMLADSFSRSRLDIFLK